MEDKAKKALLICSVHALGDFPAFERAAFDTALADHEEATQLSAADHARIIEKTTILEMMQRFPNPGNKQKALVENYLEVHVKMVDT